MIVGFIVLYPAVSPSMALTTDLVVGSVPPEKAGAAGGLASTVNDLGISLGVAVIGSIGTAVYRDGIDDKLPDGLSDSAASAARENLDGAVAAARELPGQVGDQLLVMAREAFTSGLNVAAGTAAVIAAAGAVAAALSLRHVPPTGSAVPDTGPAEASPAPSVPAADSD